MIFRKPPSKMVSWRNRSSQGRTLCKLFYSFDLAWRVVCVWPLGVWKQVQKKKTFQGGWYPLETIVPMNHIPLLHWLLWLYDKHTHSGPIFPSSFLPLNVFTSQLPQAHPNIGVPNWSIVKLMVCKTKVFSMVAKWQVCQRHFCRHFCSTWILGRSF